MVRLVLLDSGLLGLIVRAPGKPQVVRCITWLKAISAPGATVLIPEIAHYEVRRTPPNPRRRQPAAVGLRSRSQ
jgi:hypothetical protein